MDVLKIVHPYFLNKQSKYFMVLSQSCDLVRRTGKKCKTPYITLAAVKDYTEFLKKVLLNGKYAEEVKGLLLMDEKNRDRAYQLVNVFITIQSRNISFSIKKKRWIFRNLWWHI